MSVREDTVYSTSQDAWTRRSTANLIEWVNRQADSPLEFSHAVDLVGGSRPTSFEDLAQFAIDHLNEEAPLGVYYYLTADANVIRSSEREEDQ